MACTAPPVPEEVLALDLEADVGLGLVNNDPVALWIGQSSSGINATQSVGADQPTFKSADGPGGRPCVSFDGTTDFLELTSGILSQRYTIFAVIRPANNALHIILCGDSGSLLYRTSNSVKQTLRKCNNPDIGDSNTSLSLVSFQQIAVAWDGTNAIFRLNGAADGFLTNPTSITAPLTRVGINPTSNNQWFTGDICMIRVFTDVLALDQIQAQETANSARWGV